jgi:CubicO group peptidase (beta-lactamase class C family)
MNGRRQFMLAALAMAAGCARGASARLAGIRPRMQALAQAGQVAGVVTLVQQHGRIIHLEAAGWRDLATRAPMRTDTIFQVMSQSKTFIAAAVMLLQDENRLNVEDPVERYLPEFGGAWLLEAGTALERRLRRPARAITIADLLSHASGLPDAAPATRAFAVKMRYSLAEVTALLSQQPLEAEPGARWRYSNQGIAAAARVVEVVSGQPYEEFVASRLFAPLGMEDSSFRPTPAQRPRIASAYEMAGGVLREMGPDSPGGGDLKLRIGTRYPLPEAGIFSTASDMARFHQLILDGGNWRGTQLLSRRSVALMLTPRIAVPAQARAQAGAQALGWRIQTVPGAPLPLPAGAFHHSGAFGSIGWADPARGLVGQFLVQRPDAVAERNTFIDGVYADMED